MLRRSVIKRVLDGFEYYGCVQDIEQGRESGERLYFVEYTDGDIEHMTADQEVMLAVQELVSPEDARAIFLAVNEF